MANESISEQERHQREQILELDHEELLIEEVDDDSSDEDRHAIGSSSSGGLTFNTGLASLHTYLGNVEDTHHRDRVGFLEGGDIFSLPIFYLEGVVLFPEAILPLRVIEPNFIAAIERALTQVDDVSSSIIGVVRAHRNGNSGQRASFSSVGTTAEIRQYRRLDDGTLNIVTRGQHRFRLRRPYIDSEGVPCGEIQIIKEDLPLRTPIDALGDRLPLNKGSEENSDESFESSLSLTEKRVHQSAIVSCSEPENGGDSGLGLGKSSMSLSRTHSQHVNQSRRRFSRTFWPFWVYRMYDSYCLAQKASDMWKQIVGAPSMEGLVKKPDLLSFYIASKIPVSESTRQELLEIDGISYRLRREIELLESVNLIKCRHCQTVIARRSDMLAMSSDGPLGAYVNSHGFVHEVITLYRANDLTLVGVPVREYSWFPGYAWTITNCASCGNQMGWLFTATKKNLKPRLFWGIRSSEVSI
ncbi:uncharacterized protein LOC133802239 [Humulus lupulus]|uniref:uncharacterized protein LOC133802239 n=1 Tax=Humulus lupulus TaxID=3486 RepID=UPI002B408156|nr:uncharacterized protein LOC133802239 [Humulus lupulus]XP_062096494.1 uncharacterized protein LOC133802239 [Humulus lupulus]